MTILVPFGGIAIFISLYLFREYNRVQKVKRAERRAQIRETNQKMVDKLVERKMADGRK